MKAYKNQFNPLKNQNKKEVKMSEENLEERVQGLEQAQELLAQKVNTLPELKNYLDKKFEELGTSLIELANRPDEGEVEQRGVKRGQEMVVSAFENNALVGELEPIARRIFDAIRSQGYDIVPKGQLTEATGETETKEEKAKEAPEPPYLHIIGEEDLIKLPDEQRKEYSPWTESKFARLVEA